ncbi:Trm112 family protein [Alphaproteobacteria bacterium LSUCC0684]
MSATENEDARPLDPILLDLLICPVSRGPLTYDRTSRELISRQAGLAYPVRDGVPVLLKEEARTLDGAES